MKPQKGTKSRTNTSLMRTILFVCLLICLAVAPSAAQSGSQTDAVKYIGRRYGPTQPPGIKYVGGALISELEDQKEYGISQVHKGRVKVLWFERMTHRDERGVPYWELMDVLVVPPHTRKQVVVYATCLMENRADKEIVAIADYQPGEQYFTRVRKAWRANRQTEKFEVIPTKGIKCENDGFGI